MGAYDFEGSGGVGAEDDFVEDVFWARCVTVGARVAENMPPIPSRRYLRNRGFEMNARSWEIVECRVDIRFRSKRESEPLRACTYGGEEVVIPEEADQGHGWEFEGAFIG